LHAQRLEKEVNQSVINQNQTPIVYTEDILTWKELEFVKGKPKGTNPAIMGNPINMYALNGCKKQSYY